MLLNPLFVIRNILFLFNIRKAFITVYLLSRELSQIEFDRLIIKLIVLVKGCNKVFKFWNHKKEN